MLFYIFKMLFRCLRKTLGKKNAETKLYTVFITIGWIDGEGMGGKG